MWNIPSSQSPLHSALNAKISDERFRLLSSGYDEEQKWLKSAISSLSEQIESSMEQSQNIDRFIEVVGKHTDIQELDSASSVN